MAKLTLNPIGSGYQSTAGHTANYALIEAAIENTLSLDGTTPNSMGASLDMNSNRVINLAAPVNPNDAARLSDVGAGGGGGGGGDAYQALGLDQFAATTSAELAGVISDETGTGALVFGTSPTLVTPALGTPSALVGTNITGTAASLTAGNATAAETADIASLLNGVLTNVTSAATTSDIWTPSSNSINFQGSATVTAFPTAPAAGYERTLVIDSAATLTFTADANLLIDGRVTGEVVTPAANEIWKVIALTTTKFKLTKMGGGYEYGTWTPNLGGTETWNSTPTGMYVRIGPLVYVACLLWVLLLGTGSTGTIYGLPFTPAFHNRHGLTCAAWANLSASYVNIQPYVQNSIAEIRLNGLTGASTSMNSVITPYKDGMVMQITGCYTTNYN